MQWVQLIYIHRVYVIVIFFFFNDTATTEIYTLSLHDALPISEAPALPNERLLQQELKQQQIRTTTQRVADQLTDRKSTRLNSSHSQISYAVFCLKKKKTPLQTITRSTGFGLYQSVAR